MPKKSTTPITAYSTYLPNIELNGSQAQTDCPFCGREEHFFISQKTGQYDCKVCSEKGNLYNFLEYWYLERLKETTEEDHEELSELRGGFPAKAFVRIAKDEHRWLIPSYNREGKFSNLRLWMPGKAIHSTATCSLHLIGIEELKPDGPIYLVEGDWDYFTLTYLLNKRKGNKASVLGVPGCNTFKEHWVEYFQDRDTIALYDNDGGGSDGMDLVEKKLLGKVSSLQRIVWPSGLPEKYDVSDYCLDNIRKTKKAIDNLKSACIVVADSAKKKELPKRKPNLKKIIAAYRKVLKIGKQEVDAITLIHAVATSVQIKDDPLWLFLVGPPGSGKTALLKPMDCSENCITRSRVTPASLVSGFVPDNSDNDPSLIPKLKDHCFVLKDWTEIKSMSHTDEEAIYGIMRGAYDGKVEFEFGNDVYRNYQDCWFSLLAGVTNVIHGDHRASLGERFLKFQLVGQNYDPTDQIRAAMEGIGKKTQVETELGEAVAMYGNWKINLLKLPKVPKWMYDRVLHLSQIIAILRMNVDRTYKGDLAYRPQTEIATRLAKILIKLAMVISVVQEKPITKETYRLVKKVAFDTAIGWGSEIILLLMENPRTPQLRQDLERSARVSAHTLSNKLKDLVQIRAIDPVAIKDGERGRPQDGFLPSQQLQQLWKLAKLHTD